MRAREGKNTLPPPPTSFCLLNIVPLTRFETQPPLCVLLHWYTCIFCLITPFSEHIFDLCQFWQWGAAAMKLCSAQPHKTSACIHYSLHDLHPTVWRLLTGLWAVFPVGLTALCISIILQFKWTNVLPQNDVTCKFWFTSGSCGPCFESILHQ